MVNMGIIVREHSWVLKINLKTLFENERNQSSLQAADG